MITFNIEPVSKEYFEDLRQKINSKAKPPGALGYLEKIAMRIGAIQQTVTPGLYYPAIAVFAADHGIAEEGVSPYPQEVTYQMVYDFLENKAGVNVFAAANGLKVKVVDAGVNHQFKYHPNLINAKIRMGTRNFCEEPAMTVEECKEAIKKGKEVITRFYEEGSNVIGFGEMGIGKTSSASVLISLILDIPIEEIVSYGSGLDEEGLKQKVEVLKKAMAFHHVDKNDPVEILRTFGGYDTAMICGGMLRAAQLNMIIIVDGFTTTAAAVMAYLFNKNVLDYCFFSHLSSEKSHWMVLERLHCRPILNLDLRLGQGSGVALAYPIIKSAVAFLNDMAEVETEKKQDLE